MAQLKDSLITGSLRVTDTLYTAIAQLAILKAPTASNGTTYGPGSANQVLKSNGTSVYWGADAQGVTSITLTSGTGITVSDSGTAITDTGSCTISLANNYGDTKNPYASKTQGYVLAAPSNADGVPSFRALVAADIPTLTKAKISDFSHDHGNITNGGLLATANRLVWTDGNKKVYAGYHYATTDKVAINSTAAPTENFYVSGTTQFNIGTSDTSSNKRLKIVGNGRFLSFGGSGIMAYTTANNTDSAGTLHIQYYGGNVNIGNASNTVATTIYGSLTLHTNSSAFTAYNSNALGSFVGPGVISSCVTAAGNGYYLIGGGTQYGRWFIKTIGTANNGTTQGAQGEAVLEVGNSTPLIPGASTGGAHNSCGIIRIYGTNAYHTDILAQANGDNSCYLPNYDNDMFLVHAGDNQAIGSGKKPVYVAENGRVTVCNTKVGDPYTPIYANYGEFTATSPVQYFTWSISSGKYGVSMTDNDEIFKANTYSITLVVLTGESNLNAPLTWTSGNGTFSISTAVAVSGNVTGYAIIARGANITDSITFTQKDSNT